VLARYNPLKVSLWVMPAVLILAVIFCVSIRLTLSDGVEALKAGIVPVSLMATIPLTGIAFAFCATIMVRALCGSPAIYVRDDRLIYIMPAYFAVRIGDIESVTIEDVESSFAGKFTQIAVKTRSGRTRIMGVGIIEFDRQELGRSLNMLVSGPAR
jgi:hypothetical protein